MIDIFSLWKKVQRYNYIYIYIVFSEFWFCTHCKHVTRYEKALFLCDAGSKVYQGRSVSWVSGQNQDLGSERNKKKIKMIYSIWWYAFLFSKFDHRHSAFNCNVSLWLFRKLKSITCPVFSLSNNIYCKQVKTWNLILYSQIHTKIINYIRGPCKIYKDIRAIFQI